MKSYEFMTSGGGLIVFAAGIQEAKEKAEAYCERVQSTFLSIQSSCGAERAGNNFNSAEVDWAQLLSGK